MEVKAKHVYKKSVDAVFATFGDKAGLEKKFQALGARNIKIESCKSTKNSLDVIMTREVPVDAPAILKKFLGEWNSARQEEHWKGTPGKSYEADLKVTFKGVPVTITGKMLLSGDAKGCVNDVTLRVESSVPLIGGKLAEFVGNSAASEAQKQYEYIRDNT